MFRFCFFGLLTLWVDSGLFATTEPETVEGETSVNEAEAFRARGRIQFDKPLHDFGSVLRGQKLRYSFTFKNVGLGPLEVHGVHASCGCTVVSSPKQKTFAPGDVGSLEVDFDTEHFEGRIQKTISVMTNEIEKASRLLTLVATVRSEVMANPPILDFGDVLVDETSEAIVTIVKDRSVKLKSEAIKLNPTIFAAQVLENSEESTKIKVNLKSAQNAGFLKEQLVLPIEGAALNELRIPLRANVLPHTKLSENYIELGAIGSGESVNRKVLISSSRKVQLVSHRIEIKLNQEDLKTDPSQWISLDYPQQLAPKESKELELKFKNLGINKIGSIHGRVYVQTDDPKQKELTLDFYGFMK